MISSPRDKQTMHSGLWDVIVIGAGSSGLPAAIFAAERGAKVLQIEADDRIGGTLHWSSGQMAAAGTKIQKDLGIDDTPEEHYKDAQRISSGTIDPLLGKIVIDNAADTIDWLMDIGFELSPDAPQTGVVHESYKVRRYYWGVNAGISVLDAITPIYEKLVDAGKITLLKNTRFQTLLMNDDKVDGIVTTDADGQQVEFSGKNVVLASGGYAANPEMWARFNPDHPLCSFCNPFSRGDALSATKKIGAKIDGQDKYLCTFAGWREEPDNPTSGQFYRLAPVERRSWEIYVDQCGNRLIREDHPSIDALENKLLEQPDTKMFIVCDDGILQNAPPITLLPEAEFKAKFGEHPNFLKADSVKALARQMGVNVDNLEATIKTFNDSVDAQKDPTGREFLLRKIEQAPFYAMGAHGITVASPAGLAVNENLNVIKENGEPIENLFGAGEVLGFARATGNAFCGGMSLTPALTGGRLLGQKILQW